jgi:uncharacterized RDD family membrane protein YckC/Tfp pilus assembly major pilin PilA
MYCGNCGVENLGSNKFCTKCGRALAVSTPAASAAPKVEAAPMADGPVRGVTDEGRALPYAGFWRRFAAYVIDVIVLYFVLVVVMVLIMRGAPPQSSSAMRAFLVVASLIAPWLYYSLTWSSRAQASLGKLALGVKVTDEGGNRVGFGRATGRYFAEIVTAFTFGVGYGIQVLTRRRQALHDILAGTLVVHKACAPSDISAAPEAPKVNGLIATLVIILIVLFNPMGIGILAAIAIPAYQDYTIRAQVVDGLNMSSAYKVAVSEALAQGQQPAAINSESLTISSPTSGKYVDEIKVVSGVVAIKYGNSANPAIAGKEVLLVPAIDSNQSVTWICGHAGPPSNATPVVPDAGKYTTLADRQLPLACRK